MKPGFFAGCGSRVLEAARKENLGEHFGVVLSSLGGKSKEDKEDERANDARPLRQGIRDHYKVVAPPEDRRDLSNTAEMIMSIFPTDPWHNGSAG